MLSYPFPTDFRGPSSILLHSFPSFTTSLIWPLRPLLRVPLVLSPVDAQLEQIPARRERSGSSTPQRRAQVASQLRASLLKFLKMKEPGGFLYGSARGLPGTGIFFEMFCCEVQRGSNQRGGLHVSTYLLVPTYLQWSTAVINFSRGFLRRDPVLGRTKVPVLCSVLNVLKYKAQYEYFGTAKKSW